MSKIYSIPVEIVERDEIVVKAKSKKEAIEKARGKIPFGYRMLKKGIEAMSQKEARERGFLESDWMDE